MGETEVLIVGAGPTGLMLAIELARHGVVPVIVDERSARSVHSKALAIHSRTLEVFEDVGVLATVMERARRMHGVNVYAGGKRIVSLAFDELDAPHPYVAILPQSDTEEILEAHALELGVSVERESKLVALAQDDDGVTATLERPDGSRREVRARWLVGCDGAHSTVRREVGIAFEGEDLDARFALADVRVDWELDQDESRLFFSPDGPLAFFPLPEDGRWRIVATVRPDEVPNKPSLATFQRLYRDRAHVEATIEDATWLSAFTVRQRKVRAYRSDRVFLAGDAAHAHSPLGGQGMNTGLQDAYNLGWKLARVVRGRAQAKILDSYHAEREPIAAQVLRGTGITTKLVTLRHPVAQAVRNHLAPFLTSLEVVQQRAARGFGELDVAYRRSPIVAEHRAGLAAITLVQEPDDERPSLGDARDFGAAPRPGERAVDAELGDGRRLHQLLSGTTHVLLMFDGRVASPAGYERMQELARAARAAFGAGLRAHAVIPAGIPEPELPGIEIVRDADGHAHGRYGAAAECAYLVRPDGYVGFRCQPIDSKNLAAWAESAGFVTR